MEIGNKDSVTYNYPDPDNFELVFYVRQGRGSNCDTMKMGVQPKRQRRSTDVY